MNPTDPMAHTPGAPDSRTVIDTAATAQSDAAAPQATGHRTPPAIPDHELLRPIGRGSYGEVWLARNIMGTFRAVKIVYRASFEREKPFEREFTGIQKFEPISRSHSGLVDILQIGRTPDCFYYVMELADDATTGQEIDPARYQPRTLRSEVVEHGRVPIERCVEIGLGLASGLQHLHGHGLIHRDIKPSNIIFVHGQPKLADIGLVAEQSEAKSFVGTEGFIPPEGPGTPAADVYSLGKVLYEMATGKDRHEFPELPTLTGTESEAGLVELNAIILKACQNDLKSRYPTAEQLRQDLLLMQSGKSVKRAQVLEKRFRLLLQALFAGLLVAMVALGGLYFFRQQAERESALRRRSERNQYSADMSLAYHSWQNGHFGRARRLVDQQQSFLTRGVEDAANEPPQLVGGSTAWEWRYLWARTRGDDEFVLGRHEPLAEVALWFDSRRVASIGKDAQVRIWDVHARRLLQSHTVEGRLTGLAMLANGARLAIAFADGRLAVYETEGFRKVWEVTMPHQIGHIVCSLDSQWVAAGGGKGVSLLSAANGQLIWQSWTSAYPESYWFKLGLAFSPDSRWLAYSIGRPFGLLRIVTREVQILERPEVRVSDDAVVLKFSPDGRRLALGDRTGRLEIWDATTRQLRERKTAHRHCLISLDFSPDGRHLASGGTDQALRLWNVENLRELAALSGHDFEIWSVAYSPDGQRLVTASKDDTIRIWPARTTLEAREEVSSNDEPWIAGGWSVAFQTMLRISSRDHTRLDLRTGRRSTPVPLPAEFPKASTSAIEKKFLDPGLVVTPLADGGMAAASSGTGLRAWTASGDPAWSLEDSESRILNIAANEAYLAVAHQSGILEVLELGDSQPQLHRQLRLPPPADKLTPYRAVLDWNRMGTRLASALEHSPEVLIWEAGTDRSWTIRVDHREGILNLSMSTDGTRLFTTSYDAAAALWDVDTGRSLARFSGQLSAFGSGAISPDNSRVALGGNDGTLSICDAESGQEMARFPALNGFINFVAWDDRGDALMTASTDSMRIFRAPAWQQILVTKSLPKQTPSNSRDDNILQSGSR